MICLYAYVIIFIIFGVPIIWSYIISSNQRLLSKVHSYGSSVEEKWENLCGRLQSSGINIFSQYKYKHTRWVVTVLFFKFVLCVLTTIGNHYLHYLIYILPLFYVFTTVVLVISWPYRNKIHNIIDTLLGIVNFLISSIPFLASVGVIVPEIVATILTIAGVVLPILAIILIIILAKTRKTC